MALTPHAPAPLPSPHRRKQRRRPESHANHERWLVSYADFITLLFAFFTTMYAISTVDAQKLRRMAESVQGAFDAHSTAQVLEHVGNQPAAKGGPTDQVGLGDLEKRLTARLAVAVSDRRVEVEHDERGLIISIRESGSFAAGSTDLSAPAQELLVDLGSALTDVSNKVLVEGHTDDVPIKTSRFASNWELSTARATNVVRYLLEHSSLPPQRLSAAGYAQYHPRVGNDTPENRARNRRVDIVILRSTPPPAAMMAAPGTAPAPAHE